MGGVVSGARVGDQTDAPTPYVAGRVNSLAFALAFFGFGFACISSLPSSLVVLAVVAFPVAAALIGAFTRARWYQAGRTAILFTVVGVGASLVLGLVRQLQYAVTVSDHYLKDGRPDGLAMVRDYIIPEAARSLQVFRGDLFVAVGAALAVALIEKVYRARSSEAQGVQPSA